MEKFSIDLQPEPAKPINRFIQRSLFGLVGVSNIVQAILSDNYFRYISMLFGLGAIVFAIGYRWFYKPKLFSFDDIGIEGPISTSKNILRKWENIAKIEISLFNLKIYAKSGELSNVYLGNLTFQHLREIKTKIFDLAKSKGIEVLAA